MLKDKVSVRDPARPFTGRFSPGTWGSGGAACRTPTHLTATLLCSLWKNGTVDSHQNAFPDFIVVTRSVYWLAIGLLGQSLVMSALAQKGTKVCNFQATGCYKGFAALLIP